ncbi:MAG TPA: GNAT family N-acetyltransferase [Xanthobacteraceae bacterium]|nr:GNAT family N-acetyltransferase [Xanthobacteraceae bacterium]
MLQLAEIKSSLRGQVVGRDAVSELVPAWEALGKNSIEDNVYYCPRYARALMKNVERDTALRFALVWEGADLIALLPFTAPRIRIPVAGTGAQAWQTKYTFSCAPLLDKQRFAEAADTLLDVMAACYPGEWVLPRIYTQGAACQAMTKALAANGRPWLFANNFLRATLESGTSFDALMQSHISPKRRRELARNRRRLEELGPVTHEIHRSGAGLENAVAAFLQIETSGWKGKRGTALACAPATRQFAIDVFTGSEADSICRADVLTLAGKPVAVGLTLFAGRTGFAVKCAYDEAYRAYSAGLLLELEVMRSLLSECWADRLDSGTDGKHVIDGLWPGRLEVADLIFSCAPRYSQWRVSTFQRTEQVRQTARRATKSLVSRLMEL